MSYAAQEEAAYKSVFEMKQGLIEDMRARFGDRIEVIEVQDSLMVEPHGEFSEQDRLDFIDILTKNSDKYTSIRPFHPKVEL